jgi:hypothetical protein|tara:strand:+ start:1027 stop:3477 length:2451 start_codon:yes stop_codon:yes gene_type:complete
MPLFNSAPAPFVREELLRRIKGLAKHIPGVSPEDRYWHHQKTPYIRLVSNAVPLPPEAGSTKEGEKKEELWSGEFGNGTRFEHILFAGTAKGKDDDTFGQRHGFDQMYSGIYKFNEEENPTMDDVRSQGMARGFKAMPGITGATISYKGSRGALKKASVSWVCYQLDDLERYETFYMTPGIRVLVEWGWSVNHNEPLNLMPLDDEILKNPTLVQQEINKRRKSSGGCYDAMFGYTVNFSWALRDDMSFDCKTEITAMGDTTLNMPLGAPVSQQGQNEDDDKKAKESRLSSALLSIGKQIKENVSSIEEKNIKLKDIIGIPDVKLKVYSYKFGATSKFKDTIESDIAKTAADRFNFVKFGDLVDKVINPLYKVTSNATRESAADEKDKTKPAAGPLMTMKIGSDMNNTGEEPMYTSIIGNDKFLLSTDPSVCLIPGQIGDTNYSPAVKTANRPSGLSSPDDIDLFAVQKLDEAIYRAGIIEPEDSAGPMTLNDPLSAGYLGNIFVNVNECIRITQEEGTLEGYMEALLSSMNEACGNPWDLRLVVDEMYPNICSVVDNNFTLNDNVYVTELPAGRQHGILRKLDFRSKIPNGMKQMLALGANTGFTGSSEQKNELQASKLIPLDCGFELDGISGIQFGQGFMIDYIPTRYQNQVYFFVKDVKHTISATDWSTDVDCIMRFLPQNDTYTKLHYSKLATAEDKLTDLETEGKEIDDITKQERLGTFGIGEKPGDASYIYPNAMVMSLDSQGITIGEDTTEGKDETSVKDERLTVEDMQDKITRLLTNIYKRANIEEIDACKDLLTQILSAPREGGETGG